MLDKYSNDYLYLGAIQAIKRMKTGAPFGEIAPMLNDISQLPEWSKLLMGLLKYFQAEVLLKLPVVQHVPFGSIIVGPTHDENVNKEPSTIFFEVNLDTRKYSSERVYSAV